MIEHESEQQQQQQQHHHHQQPRQDAEFESSVSYTLRAVEIESVDATSPLIAPFTVIYVLCCSVILAVAVSMVTISVLYRNDCPAQDDLGLYLLVLGVGLALRLAVYCWCRCLNSCCSDSENGTGRLHWMLERWSQVLEVTLLVLLVIESIKVYNLYQTVEYADPKAANYCQPVLFKYTFWMLASLYFVLLSATAGQAMVSRSCCCCFRCCCCCYNYMEYDNESNVHTV